MEPRIETDLLYTRARYFLPPMMRSEVALASVIPIVPQECTSYCGMHTERLPIPLAQPIEASSTPACPGRKTLVRLQIRKDCLQSTLVTFATSGRIVVVMALEIFASRITGGLQPLEALHGHPRDGCEPPPNAFHDRVVLSEEGSSRRAQRTNFAVAAPLGLGGLEACVVSFLNKIRSFRWSQQPVDLSDDRGSRS